MDGPRAHPRTPLKVLSELERLKLAHCYFHGRCGGWRCLVNGEVG